MNRDFASKGYKVVSGTDATAHPFFGFTTLEETQIATVSGDATAVVAPESPGPEHTAYVGDEAGLEGLTIPAGLFLPIRGSSIKLASGKVILWTE